MKHVVGFSGGADSQACALWVRQRFPAEDVLLLNTQAGGNEHPLTVEFIDWYSAHVFPVTVVQPLIRDLGDVGTRDGGTGQRRREYAPDEELTFPILAYIKGRFPSRKAQFCTEYLKLAPQRRWIAEHLAGEEIRRYIGVRRDESAGRANCADAGYDDYFKCTIARPLASWTKAQVFQYLQDAGEPFNPLYTLGFGRVGCAPCINSGKEDIRLWVSRFPEMIAKVRDWETKVGRSFFAPVVPGKKINWIDEVVAWSKTARGGKQLALPLLEAEVTSGACMSKYGLCE